MPISIDELVKQTEPASTVLLFGAGASIPSGAPSVGDLMVRLGKLIGVEPGNFGFDELCSLVEQQRDRRELVNCVRSAFRSAKPTKGLLNIPLFDWCSIYTTNYDELVEKSYEKKQRPYYVCSSNFDFGDRPSPNHQEIFKLHGTLQHDVCDGHRSRLVLTTEDNESVEDYREHLFDRLRADLAYNDLIIIGYSLSDADLKDIVRRAVSLRAKSSGGRRISLLMFNEDQERAKLLEARGIKVAFGGIDDFVATLTRYGPERSVVYQHDPNSEVLCENLVPITQDVEHAVDAEMPSISRMYNGSPATCADIKAGFTFARSAKDEILNNLAQNGQTFSIVLGASGVGKTTIARQTLLKSLELGKRCWAHVDNNPLLVGEWLAVALRLQQQDIEGILFIDDAHDYLFELNQLAEQLSAHKVRSLKIILCSSKNLWGPRLKSTSLLKSSTYVEIDRLNSTEIEELISLTAREPQIAPLVERSFSGFSDVEKRRRLKQRCESEFFVCLKNIFANESFDDIILREFAAVKPDYQGIYRTVAALESMGVVVHRQLVLRLTKIEAGRVPEILEHLDGVVEEYNLSARGALFGWRGRHLVISEIIRKYKFDDSETYFCFMEDTVRNLLPSYDCEIKSMNQLCSSENGIQSIPDKKRQNKLYRMMMSNAPGQRVPRHRLIRNLISMGQFEDAETEIRLFAQDIGKDGPIERYKVVLLLERAKNSGGLMDEDRLYLLNKAIDASVGLIGRYGRNKHTLETYGNVALEYYKQSGELTHYDDAMEEMKELERELGDPEITNLIGRFDRKLNGMS